MIAPADGPFDLTVLLVEDDPLLRELLTDMLTDEGAHVTACASAEEAVNLAATALYDVVLSDVMMEGMGGCGLYDWLTQRRPDLSRRFVFMTAEPNQVQAFAAQAGRPLLAKPFTCERLVETLRDVATD